MIPLLFFSNESDIDIITLVTTEWPPYYYLKDNEPSGPVIEILEYAFKEMQLLVHFKFYPWARAVEMVRGGSVDGIFSLSRSEEREEWLIFPNNAIHSSDNVLFYKIGNELEFSGDINELEGKIMGITRGYTYAGALESLRNSLLVLEESSNDISNILKLSGDRIDLFICDRFVGLSIIEDLGLKGSIKYHPHIISSADYYIAFSDDSIYLSDLLDSKLSKAKEEGIMDKIFSDYFDPL